MAPLPPGSKQLAGNSEALQFDARQYDAYLTYLVLAVGVHSHSATCRKGGRGEECCRLAYAAGCWNTLPAPVELLRSNDGTVFAMRALTPHDVANPPDAHNPYFPLARPDSRVVTWEMFRPSPGVTRDDARAELDAYLQRCKDKATDFGDLDLGLQHDLAIIQAARDAAGSQACTQDRDAAADAVMNLLHPVIGDPSSDHDDVDMHADPVGARATLSSSSSAAAAGAGSELATFTACVQGPNQWVVPHSRAITSAVRCNTSVNLLLNQDAARCASFYLAKYVPTNVLGFRIVRRVCTPSLPAVGSQCSRALPPTSTSRYLAKEGTDLTQFLPLLLDVFMDVQKYPSRADDTGSSTRSMKHVLTRCVNSLSKEYSITTAALALLQHPHEAFSHGFAYCFARPAVAHCCRALLSRTASSSSSRATSFHLAPCRPLSRLQRPKATYPPLKPNRAVTCQRDRPRCLPPSLVLASTTAPTATPCLVAPPLQPALQLPLSPWWWTGSGRCSSFHSMLPMQREAPTWHI